jgi:hypothetical protein
LDFSDFALPRFGSATGFLQPGSRKPEAGIIDYA